MFGAGEAGQDVYALLKGLLAPDHCDLDLLAPGRTMAYSARTATTERRRSHAGPNGVCRTGMRKRFERLNGILHYTGHLLEVLGVVLLLPALLPAAEDLSENLRGLSPLFATHPASVLNP